ncbi:MAG: hypothetical protein N2490_07730 [Ignavibacteria bacterium]|nr:hypothetical protein [Ignavibacteria bacterium]
MKGINSINEFHEELKLIKKDKYSGSQKVLNDFLVLFKDFLSNSKDLDSLSDEALFKIIKYDFRGLLESHNQFALLRHFNLEIMNACDSYFTKLIDSKKHGFDFKISLKDFLLQRVENYIKTWISVNDRIAVNTLRNIDFADKTVLLHSNSSTVRHLFNYIRTQSIPVEIIQTESRPKCEGRVQADYISSLGFKVTYIIDAAAIKYLAKVDFVLMGCDSVYPDYFINKVGTEAIAIGCRTFKIPFYVITDSRKISSTDYIRPENKKPISEIISGASVHKFNIENYYFESIPNEFITKLITESNVYEQGFKLKF